MRVTKNAAGGILALAAAAAMMTACGSAGTTHSSGSVQPGGIVHAHNAGSDKGAPADSKAKSAPSGPVSRAPSSPAPTTAAPAPPSAPPQTPTPTVNGAAQLAVARQALHNLGYDSFGGQRWKPENRLNALTGILSTSGDGKYQHLFFFVNGRYIGMDTTAPSVTVGVTAGSNTVITASYGMFRPNEALCCPNSYQQVRFEWTGSKLVPLDPIPPQASDTAPGR